MSDVEVQLLGPAAVVLSYRALARRAGEPYGAFAGSVYTLVAGEWLMAYHQQSV